MKVFLKDIKERFPEFEIRNYDDSAFFIAFNHDSRSIVEGEIFIPIIGERFDGHDYIMKALEQGASMSICDRSKGALVESANKPIILVDSIEEGVQKIVNYAISDIAAPIVAITGSTGKTTTKQMLVAILSSQARVLFSDHFNTVWGNAVLLSHYAGEDFIALECAMDRKGEIAWHANTFDPDVGIILNVGDVHAEKLGGIEEIYEEKKNLADYLERAGKPLVLNIDDERLIRIKDVFKSKLVTYGKRDDADFKIYDVCVDEDGTDFSFGANNSWYTVHLNAYGEELAYNAVAAIIAANLLGLGMEDCIKGITTFHPNNGRFQIEDFGAGRIVVNDAYNANPISMKMSLKTFDELYRSDEYQRIVVLGEMKELGKISEQRHKELGETVKEYGFNEVYYVGEMFESFGIGNKLQSSDEVAVMLSEKLSKTNGKKIAVLLKGSNSIGLNKIPDYLRKLGL